MNGTDVKIDYEVKVLDVDIENLNDPSPTLVFYKPATEPYILQFLSNYPRHARIIVLYEALLSGGPDTTLSAPRELVTVGQLPHGYQFI